MIFTNKDINNQKIIKTEILDKYKTKYNRLDDNKQIRTNETQQDNQIKKKNNQKELSNFLLNIIPEINKFDKGMVEYYKKDTNKNLIHANQDELRKAALVFFDKNKKDFFYLKREHIEPEANYIYTVQRRRGIIGKILKGIVITEFPHLLGDKEINTCANFLYKQFKELEINY